MKERKEPIHAVIGVRHRGSLTYYVKRSLAMPNYPGVWSLFRSSSILWSSPTRR